MTCMNYSVILLQLAVLDFGYAGVLVSAQPRSTVADRTHGKQFRVSGMRFVILIGKCRRLKPYLCRRHLDAEPSGLDWRSTGGEDGPRWGEAFFAPGRRPRGIQLARSARTITTGEPVNNK